MAGGEKVLSDAVCKYCKSKCLSGPKCDKCGSQFHSSCARRIKNLVFITDESVNCCEDDSYDSDEAKVGDNCTSVKDEVTYLKCIIKQKDEIIFELREKNKLLYDKIALLEAISLMQKNVNIAKNNPLITPVGDTSRQQRVKNCRDNDKADNTLLSKQAKQGEKIISPVADNTADYTVEQKSGVGNDDGFEVYRSRRERKKSNRSLKPSTTDPEEIPTGRQTFTRETVSKAIRAAQRGSFVGKNESATLQVAQRYIYKWYFVSRLDTTITADDIKGFLENQQKGHYIVEELTPRYDNASYKSFKIGVPFKTADTIMSPDIWPYGVFINRFYFGGNKRSDPVKSNSGDAAAQLDFPQETRLQTKQT